MGTPAPGTPGSNPWLSGRSARGHDYDRRFEELAASGQDMHGEAALVDSYANGHMSVLDAGCGTGRVAIELHRRGHDVVGVDLDPDMLGVARRKDPSLSWVQGDLSDPALLGGAGVGRQFEAVVLAGNVLIFVTPGTEGAVLANVARLLVPGGRAIAGYSLHRGSGSSSSGFGVAQHDDLARAHGLELEDRWSTWGRESFGPDSTYAVSVHRKAARLRGDATEGG
jgi:SAM-dependent methyltransferase